VARWVARVAFIGLVSSLMLLLAAPDRITIESMEKGARSRNEYHVELRPAATLPLGESSQIAVRLTRISDRYSEREVEVELTAPSTIEVAPRSLSISRSRDFGQFTVVALRQGRQTIQVSTRLRPLDSEGPRSSDESSYDRHRTLTRPVEPRSLFRNLLRRKSLWLLAAGFSALCLGSVFSIWMRRLR